MNKKKLSVVMAGAMLASSVAPVLAAETTVTKSEVSAAELGLLIKRIRETLESKKFANDTVEDKKANGDEAGKSVYFIKVNGTTYKDAQIDTQEELQRVLGGLVVGSTVEIHSKGFRTETVDDVEKYYATNSEAPKYEKSSELEALEDDVFQTKAAVGSLTPALKTAYSNILKVAAYENKSGTVVYKEGTGYNAAKGVFVIDFVEDLNKKGINDIELKVGSEKLNLKKYIDDDKAIQDVSTGAIDATKFLGFANEDKKYIPIGESTVEEITVVSGGNSYELSDLYDGLMLKEKGQNLLELAKAAKAAVSDAKTAVKVIDLNTTSGDDVTSDSVAGDTLKTPLVKNVKTGKYNVKLQIADSFNPNTVATPKNFKDFYISATDVDDLNRVLMWLDGAHAQVDVLAGNNRYETAVKIAKEVALLESVKKPEDGTDGEGNIVLVNGDSLVDGLSASPLAAYLGGKSGKAPILLTRANELPKETKAYLRTLLADAEIGGLKKVTINIVGGTSVVSKAVEKELRAEGFNIERFGGDNREETSLAVAEKIGTANGAFVVGAEGEADAMSIAGYAATDKDNVTDGNQVTPIIVSKKGGLTEDAMLTLEDVKTTVLGGEKAVSKSDYEALSSYTGKANIRRIFGANRKATNAAIINEFYDLTSSNAPESVIVAKDDVLIDALTAANLSAEQNAPVVLATKSLSTDQVNALELKAQSAKNVYQVGYGVEPSVVKTVAQRLGLAK